MRSSIALFYLASLRYQRFEKNGVMMRLDPNILPTRFRYATMSKAEVERLKTVKNIIRKGRIASIETDKVTFESGEEMSLPEDTVVVDCARNSTKFPQDKKVFDGDKINLQFIMLPPPGFIFTQNFRKIVLVNFIFCLIG